MINQILDKLGYNGLEKRHIMTGVVMFTVDMIIILAIFGLDGRPSTLLGWIGAIALLAVALISGKFIRDAIDNKDIRLDKPHQEQMEYEQIINELVHEKMRKEHPELFK